MPLYEYECDACGHRFEVIQKFSDPPLERCPKCGGTVHKLQSAPAFQFKGKGWYVTDYAKSGSSRSEQKDDAPAKDKGESKADGGKDAAKPAASTEASSSTSTAKAGD
jgi:putative FmdB family regulatory protein